MVLAGVKAVTIHDTKTTVIADLGAQFYLTEADVGKNRAEACAARLQELNTAVAVIVSTAPISEAFLSTFQVSEGATTQGICTPKPPHVSDFCAHLRSSVPSLTFSVSLFIWKYRDLYCTHIVAIAQLLLHADFISHDGIAPLLFITGGGAV